jgi:hypothetical protein
LTESRWNPASAEAIRASAACITVRRVIKILATFRDREELFREYPFLVEEDLQQALRYAAATLDNEVRYLNLVA